jgi:hypothetical protein
MSRHAAVHLVQDFCRRAGMESAAASLIEGRSLVVNGMPFSLRCADEDDRPGAWPLTLYCEFGVPPQDRRREILEALLEANLVLAHAGGGGQAFAMIPEAGSVVFVRHFALEGTGPEDLESVLAGVAEQRKAWLSDYFLDL